MRKLLITTAAIILVAALCQSCKKSDVPRQKKDDPYKSRIAVTLLPEPAIQVANGDITVTATNDTTVKLNFKIEVPNGITSFSQVLDAAKTDIAAAQGNTSYNHSITIPLSFSNPAATVVRFFLVDGKGQFVSQSYNVNFILAGAMPIYTYASKKLGGNISPLASRMDFDLGNTYTGSSINGNPTLIPLIDVFFTDSIMRNNDFSTRWPLTMGSRFAPTTITATQFANINNDASFKNLTPTQNNINVGERVGKVILFQTNMGHKGLILVKDYFYDDVEFDIKIQQ